MSVQDDDARFNAALDDCARRLRDGEPLERCLGDHAAEYRAELARLAPLAARIGGLGRDPAPDFERRLEQRLLAAVAVERRVRRRADRPLLGRLLGGGPARTAAVALVTVLVLLVGGGGALRAAGDSLPDSPLYRLKEAREATELLIARDDETRVGVLLRQLGERGRELAEAVRTDRPAPVIEVLAQRMAETTGRIVDRALDLDQRGARAPTRRALLLVRALERQVGRAAALGPPDSRPALRRLLTALQEQERRLVERAGATA